MLEPVCHCDVLSCRQTAVMICVDLTKPEEIWFTLETLLASTRSRIENVIAEMRPDYPHVRENLQRRAWERVGEEHEDRNMMDPFPVPLIIIGTKFDEFQVCFFVLNIFVYCTRCVKSYRHYILVLIKAF